MTEPTPGHRLPRRRFRVAALIPAALPSLAQASIFQGETLDAVANGAAWVVLFVAPAIAIGLFWLVHILPEKIAEKRHHPQAKAIQTLCLLSLFFGGLLWPLAWLWAYSKPVFYKMAYGTDTAEHEQAEHEQAEHRGGDHGQAGQEVSAAEEIRQLRQQLSALEARLAGRSGPDEG